ncbi:MAG: hypothetical protein GX230_09525, partial [Lentisphaerae bacterium]|nr:hypothetical protein [Lentisphaerota bacterium]
MKKIGLGCVIAGLIGIPHGYIHAAMWRRRPLTVYLFFVCTIIQLGCDHLLAEEIIMEKPIHISERLELFVDRFLINTMDKIEFQLHEPQRLALPKTPFRGAYMTVIKDGDIYRGYYRGDDPAYPGPRNYSGHPGEITCYAESRNGHEWTFPSIGLFDVNGTRSNNVILAKQPPLSH